MAPATKQTKSVAYEAPALSVASLTVAQYEDLTQEQHPVTDWNKNISSQQEERFQSSIYSSQEGQICNGGGDCGRAGGGSRSIIRNSEFAETTPAGI
jgi:hypothetical protein